MSAELVFSLAGAAAASGWVLLALAALLRRPGLVRAAGFYWPIALALLYCLLILFFFAKAPGGFGSLSAVQALFTAPWVALAGWVHYLAFDLFVGGWITGQVLQLGLPRLTLLVVLPLTFLFGPIGLLAHFASRLALKGDAA